MSGQDRAKPRRIRLHHILSAKEQGRRLSMLTSYDAVTAPLFEAAGVDMLLVGDSLGNVVLGYPGTLNVTLEDMVSATAAVARSTSRAFIVADLPFGSYQASDERGFDAAAQLIRAGAHAVKLEGGTEFASLVRLLTRGGIPVMGHLGYTPQSEHTLGGPRLQGKDAAGRNLISDAAALADAGVFALVLEMVPASLAKSVTDELAIPTIGIGAGPDCDGQVLVWTDMAGMTDWSPSFARRFGEVGKELKQAATNYVEAVADGSFPGPENTRER